MSSALLFKTKIPGLCMGSLSKKQDLLKDIVYMRFCMLLCSPSESYSKCVKVRVTKLKSTSYLQLYLATTLTHVFGYGEQAEKMVGCHVVMGHLFLIKLYDKLPV